MPGTWPSPARLWSPSCFGRDFNGAEIQSPASAGTDSRLARIFFVPRSALGVDKNCGDYLVPAREFNLQDQVQDTRTRCCMETSFVFSLSTDRAVCSGSSVW